MFRVDNFACGQTSGDERHGRWRCHVTEQISKGSRAWGKRWVELKKILKQLFADRQRVIRQPSTSPTAPPLPALQASRAQATYGSPVSSWFYNFQISPNLCWGITRIGKRRATSVSADDSSLSPDAFRRVYGRERKGGQLRIVLILKFSEMSPLSHIQEERSPSPDALALWAARQG